MRGHAIIGKGDVVAFFLNHRSHRNKGRVNRGGGRGLLAEWLLVNRAVHKATEFRGRVRGGNYEKKGKGGSSPGRDRTVSEQVQSREGLPLAGGLKRGN